MSTEKLSNSHGKSTVTEPIPGWPPEFPELALVVGRAINDGSWGKYHGRPLDELVDRLRSWLGVEFALTCCSGTIAVELALRGCGVTANHEVILAGYDFPGNFRAVESIGARPVLIDVIEDGWTIDPVHLTDAISSDTRAVIVSHLHGQLANVRLIKQICADRRVSVLEDACQVPGAIVEGSLAGTTGDVGVFSFGGSKLLTAGRGGAVVTNNASIQQRIKVFTDRGNDAFPLSQLQAVVLPPQLDRLVEFNRLRLESAVRLRSLLADQSNMRDVYPEWNEGNSPAFYKLGFLMDEPHDREEFLAALQNDGVPIDSGFRGFTKRTARRCHQATELINSQIAVDRTVLIHHPVLLGNASLHRQIASAIRLAGSR